MSLEERLADMLDLDLDPKNHEYWVDRDGVSWKRGEPETLLMTKLLEFCACGQPWDILKKLRDVLRGLESDKAQDEGDAIWLYVADRAGLTEHGGSIMRSWLSDTGKEFIAVVDELYAEEKDK